MQVNQLEREDRENPRQCVLDSLEHGPILSLSNPPQYSITSQGSSVWKQELLSSFLNLRLKSHWNLDIDPREAHWESQWLNLIDRSSQLHGVGIWILNIGMPHIYNRLYITPRVAAQARSLELLIVVSSRGPGFSFGSNKVISELFFFFCAKPSAA